MKGRERQEYRPYSKYSSLLNEPIDHLRHAEGLKHRQVAELLGIDDERSTEYKKLTYFEREYGSPTANAFERYLNLLERKWTSRASEFSTSSLSELFDVIARRLKANSARQTDIVALSSINHDTIMLTTDLGNRSADYDGHPLAVESHFGGAGANTLSFLADWGFTSQLLGAVGVDELSDLALDHLEDRGVGTSLVQRIDSPHVQSCGRTVILSLKGKRVRHIYRTGGASVHFGRVYADGINKLKPVLSETGALLITNLSDGSRPSISKIVGQLSFDVPVVIRIGPTMSQMPFDLCGDILARANVVYAYGAPFKKFVGRMSGSLPVSSTNALKTYFELRRPLPNAGLQPQLVLIKNEAETVASGGAEYQVGGQWLGTEYPQRSVFPLSVADNIDFVDSTGEGDALVAGFLLASWAASDDDSVFLHGRSSIENALHLASAAALFAGTNVGGCPKMPSIDELIQFRNVAFGVG